MKNIVFTSIIYLFSFSVCSAQLSELSFQKALNLNATLEANQFLEYVLTLEKKFPVDAKVTFLHANYQYQIGKNDDAEKSYSRSIAQDSTFTLSYIGYATIKLQKKQFNEALSILTTALKHDQKNVALYDMRSKIFLQLGQKENAIKDIDTKIEIDPLDINNYTAAAALCIKMNKSNKAEMYFAKAFTTNEMDIATVHLAYAQFLMNMQRYDDAASRYLDAIQKNVKLLTAVDYNNMAVAYFKMQNYVSAVKYAGIAMNLLPTNLDYKCNYIAILAAKKDWKKVIQAAQSILKYDDSNQFAKEYLANAMLQSGNSHASNN